MANIAVYVELRGGNPTDPSRFALQQGRAISDVLGATVYAVIPVGPVTYPELERIAVELGRMGADRVVVCTDAALGGPPLSATHGRLLRTMVMKIHPRLFIFPAGTVGPQLAAPLAAQLRATYFPGAVVTEVLAPELATGPEEPGALRLRRRTQAGLTRTLDVMSTDTQVVVTLASARPDADAGGGEAELELLSYPTSVTAMISETDIGPDPAEAEELAWAWVSVAPAVDADAETRLREAAQVPGLVVVRGESAMADVATPVSFVFVGHQAGNGHEPPQPVPPPGSLIAVCDRTTSDLDDVTLHLKLAPARAAEALAEALEAGVAGTKPEGAAKVAAPAKKTSQAAVRTTSTEKAAGTKKKAPRTGKRTRSS